MQAKPLTHLAPTCTTGESNGAVEVPRAALQKWMSKGCTARIGSRGAGGSNRPLISISLYQLLPLNSVIDIIFSFFLNVGELSTNILKEFLYRECLI